MVLENALQDELLDMVNRARKTSFGKDLLSRHPTMTTQRQNEACERRLLHQLMTLERRHDEVNARLNQEMLEMQEKMDRDEEQRHGGLWDSETPRDQPTPVSRQNSSTRHRSTASRRRRRRLVPHSCDYFTSGKSNLPCRHFPCRHPSMYHSLGFSAHSIQTFRQQPARVNVSDAHSFKQKSPTEARQAPGLSSRHLLSASHFARPLTSRGQIRLLELECAKRRRENVANKPPSWATNCGAPMPYKYIGKPARLKPLDIAVVSVHHKEM